VSIRVYYLGGGVLLAVGWVKEGREDEGGGGGTGGRG
jgi:hypothetical protein